MENVDVMEWCVVSYITLVVLMVGVTVWQRYRHKTWNWNAVTIITILSIALGFSWWLKSVR